MKGERSYLVRNIYRNNINYISNFKNKSKSHYYYIILLLSKLFGQNILLQHRNKGSPFLYIFAQNY